MNKDDRSIRLDRQARPLRVGAAIQPADLARPILPSRSVGDAVAFNKRLGSEGGAHEFDHGYAILTRGSVELHFFEHKGLVPAESIAGCYMRVADVEDFYRACSSGIPGRTGIPRISALEDKPWGLREFAVVDMNGNLIRIGQVIKRTPCREFQAADRRETRETEGGP